jgi:uncharacterized protein (DUF2345 family)
MRLHGSRRRDALQPSRFCPAAILVPLTAPRDGFYGCTGTLPRMNGLSSQQIAASLVQITSDSRLYAFSFIDKASDRASEALIAEAFAADDQLQGIGSCDVIVLSTDAHLALPELLVWRASRAISLADGTRSAHSGYITAAAGMLSNKSIAAAKGDAAARKVAPAVGTLPHASAPIIAVSAKSGLGVIAGQNLQFANGETVSIMSGQDSQWMTGGQLRVQTGQAIGLLAGAVAPGQGNAGLQLIAAQGAVDVQAQSDVLKIQARDQIDVVSAHAHIDWAAAKSITLSMAGGANITISGGNITIQCPGKILIHASQKTFSGPTRIDYLLPVLPHEDNTWVELDAHYDDAWNTPWPLENLKFKIDGKTIATTVAVNALKSGN